MRVEQVTLVAARGDTGRSNREHRKANRREVTPFREQLLCAIEEMSDEECDRLLLMAKEKWLI